MASQLDVTKLVAQHLNERWDNIDTTTDGILAEQVNLVFDDEVSMLVKTYPWTFAIRYSLEEAVTVASDVTLPPPWTAALPYPTSASKVWEVMNPLGSNHPPLPSKVVWFDYDDDATDEQIILCDTSEAYVRYTLSTVDVTDADEYFVRALSYLIAARVCLAVTGSAALQSNLQQNALLAVTQAYANNAIEHVGPDQDLDPDWITAR